jgi:tRNA U34 5-carboxymethylaminomethyl modifying GTPase MnmE/TrmE
MIRFSAIGTASTGKSAVLNALFGTKFAVDARAGATGGDETAVVQFDGRPVEVIDTAPLTGVHPRTSADACLIVCDKDLIDVEYEQIARISRPVGVAVNKSDAYTRPQMRSLLQQIRMRLVGIVPPERVISCAADPVRVRFRHTADGSLSEYAVPASPDVEALLGLVRELISEAEASLRVRARMIVAQTRDAAVTWLKEMVR